MAAPLIAGLAIGSRIVAKKIITKLSKKIRGIQKHVDSTKSRAGQSSDSKKQTVTGLNKEITALRNKKNVVKEKLTKMPKAKPKPKVKPNKIGIGVSK
jgi:hypothetical protein